MKVVSDSLATLNNDQALIIGQYSIDKVSNRLIIFEEEVKY
jgi:hypothetical protein